MEPATPEASLSERLKAEALRHGFVACRITSARPPESAPRFRKALAEGRHGEMSWLERNADKRCNPNLVLPGARSVVVLAVAYDHGPPPPPGTRHGTVARYARGTDYHEVMGPALAALSAWLDEHARPASRSLWYVDTGPILERDLAQRAGIGFVGKHTGLVSRSAGNWFLLGEILTQADLPPDPPEPNRCGRCTRCLDACPTGALPAPFTLDARLCISYLTIELKGSIPEPLRPLVGNRIFGCDDCLAVCPWNRFAAEASLLSPGRRPDLAFPSLAGWLVLDDTQFKSLFQGTPILRTKRRGLLRNVAVAMGNTGDAADLPALRRAAADPEPLVAEHAEWAIQQILRRTHGAVPHAFQHPGP